MHVYLEISRYLLMKFTLILTSLWKYFTSITLRNKYFYRITFTNFSTQWSQFLILRNHHDSSFITKKTHLLFHLQLRIRKKKEVEEEKYSANPKIKKKRNHPKTLLSPSLPSPAWPPLLPLPSPRPPLDPAVAQIGRWTFYEECWQFGSASETA